MGAQLDLATLAPGFPDAVHDSQALFRLALEAFAHPGRIVHAQAGVADIDGAGRAATGLLLALLDQDTRLWLSPGAEALGPYLRFHTGCRLAAAAHEADFAYAGAFAELPRLDTFAAGSDSDPHESATLLVEVPTLNNEGGWRLTGPGIQSEARLHAGGLAESFAGPWRAQRRHFPRGIDCFFTRGEHFAGLPRTTRIAED